MPLGLCLVGCGSYARSVARGIAPMRDDVALYFASRDRRKAEEYCRTFNDRDFFGSYEEATADGRVDAMYFLTPHNFHCENTIMAARHSKHVLVEKPIARDLLEANRMIEAARAARVKLMVAENARFMPVVQKCRELMDLRTIGRLRLIQIQAEQRHAPTDWRSSLEMNGGGALIDGGIHAVDNMVYLGGMPARLYASYLPKVLDHLEGAGGIAVMAHFPDGATGFINFSWGNASGSGRARVSLTGLKGRIQFEIGGPSWLTVETGEDRTELQFTDDAASFKSMILEFVDSIRQDRQPCVSGEEGMRNLAVVLKAYESARTGIPVNLTLGPPPMGRGTEGEGDTKGR